MGGHHTRGYTGPLKTHHLSADDTIDGVRVRKVAREARSGLIRFKLDDGTVRRYEPNAIIPAAQLRADRR